LVYFHLFFFDKLGTLLILLAFQNAVAVHYDLSSAMMRKLYG